MIQRALVRLLDGHDLSRDEARRTMAVIMSGEATDAQIAGFLVALRAKGETADETSFIICSWSMSDAIAYPIPLSRNIATLYPCSSSK